MTRVENLNIVFHSIPNSDKNSRQFSHHMLEPWKNYMDKGLILCPTQTQLENKK